MSRIKRIFKSKYFLPVLILVLIVLAVICWVNSYLLQLGPFQNTVTFEGPSGVFCGESGRTYVVDGGKKKVIILNEDGEYVRAIEGGSRENDTFYYASVVSEANDGRIYIADMVYSGKGTEISKERIVRYDADGKNGKTVYEIDYTDSENKPMQYGRIKYLTVNGNRLVFAVAESEKLTLYIYDTGSESYQEKTYDLPQEYIFDVTLDPETYLPSWVTKLGGIYTVNKYSNIDTLYEGGGVPYQLSASADGYIYYSDAQSGALMRSDYEGNQELVADGLGAYYVDAGSSRVVGSDQAGVYVWSQDGGAEYYDSVPVASQGARLVMWGVVLLCGITALLLLVGLVILLAAKWRENVMVRRIITVLLLAIIVSSVVAYFMINSAFSAEEVRASEQLQTFADEFNAAVDAEKLKDIDSLADYRSESFMENQTRLNAMTAKTYEDGRSYYYVIYMNDGSMIYAVMDYEDTVQSWMPYYRWEDGGSYTEVFETGEPVVVKSEVSTWGAWSFILSPIKDAEGNVVAVTDVGLNLDTIQERKQNTFNETLLSIVFVAIVAVMVMVEVIFYFERRRVGKSAPAETLETADKVPLRAIIFISFTVDCMQDAFVSVLASSLFTGFMGIPQSVGAALPISMQVLTAALFAVVGGNLIRKIGTKRSMSAGFVLQISGFVICALIGNYWGLLLGKMLAGAGMGMITVSANTVAASTRDEEKAGKAFADITSGTLGGVSAGAGLGSIILSFASYRIVFLAGAAVLALGLMLALASADQRQGEPAPVTEKTEDSGEKKKGIFAFLMDRRVVAFLALALLPFMMAISFREYFFPLYATEVGLSETNVGRIYVICGLLTMYLGPILSELMLKKLGSWLTLISASALMIVATMLFGFVPDMSTAVVGVVLLSISTSFGYVSQSTYYSSLPRVRQFGESRAMGVYSLFDNAGQTLGPMVYGMALMLGNQAGLLLIGEGLMILSIIFAAATITIGAKAGKKRKKTKDGKETAEVK